MYVPLYSYHRCVAICTLLFLVMPFIFNCLQTVAPETAIPVIDWTLWHNLFIYKLRFSARRPKMYTSWNSSKCHNSYRGPDLSGVTSPVSSNLMYILWAVPRLISRCAAIDRKEYPNAIRCQTIIQPTSGKYAAVRAGFAEVAIFAIQNLNEVHARWKWNE